METLVANLSSTASPRRERLNGRDYLVAPMTLIVPGVLAGSRGPLYYPTDEVLNEYHLWNNMPIVINHPSDGSARRPQVLDATGVGHVFNTVWDVTRKALRAEGWFDIEKTNRIDSQLIGTIEMGGKVELSTGLAIDVDQTPGVHNGRDYYGVARRHRPDHLAILPDTVGACSLNDGCGVNNHTPGGNDHDQADHAGSDKQDKGKAPASKPKPQAPSKPQQPPKQQAPPSTPKAKPKPAQPQQQPNQPGNPSPAPVTWQDKLSRARQVVEGAKGATEAIGQALEPGRQQAAAKQRATEARRAQDLRRAQRPSGNTPAADVRPMPDQAKPNVSIPKGSAPSAGKVKTPQQTAAIGKVNKQSRIDTLTQAMQTINDPAEVKQMQQAIDDIKGQPDLEFGQQLLEQHGYQVVGNAKKESGVWRTIRGAKVYIEGGKITKGPKALRGKSQKEAEGKEGKSRKHFDNLMKDLESDAGQFTDDEADRIEELMSKMSPEEADNFSFGDPDDLRDLEEKYGKDVQSLSQRITDEYDKVYEKKYGATTVKKKGPTVKAPKTWAGFRTTAAKLADELGLKKTAKLLKDKNYEGPSVQAAYSGWQNVEDEKSYWKTDGVDSGYLGDIMFDSIVQTADQVGEGSGKDRAYWDSAREKVQDRMPEDGSTYNVKKEGGVWRTIRGTRVYIEGGKITKGPKAVRGKSLKEISDAHDQVTGKKPGKSKLASDIEKEAKFNMEFLGADIPKGKSVSMTKATEIIFGTSGRGSSVAKGKLRAMASFGYLQITKKGRTEKVSVTDKGYEAYEQAKKESKDYYSTNNQHSLNQEFAMCKQTLIDELVENSGGLWSEEDRELLDVFDETKLQALVDNACKEGHAGMTEGEDDEEEEEAPVPMAKNKKACTCGASQQAASVANQDKGKIVVTFDDLPSDLQEDIKFARNAKQQYKDGLIDRLVANKAEGQRVACRNALGKKTITELEDMISYLPTNNESSNYEFQIGPDYSGAGAGNVPVQNRKAFKPVPLGAPVMNFDSHKIS